MTNPRPEDNRPPDDAPIVSVIIPAWVDSPVSVAILERCLDSIVSDSLFRDFELLVVDDCSPEGPAIARIASRVGGRLIRLERHSGPATARNAAARVAQGQLLVFMDADTSPHPDTIGRFVDRLRGNPSLDAVVGSYDRHPTAKGLVSRFRNLHHSFVHHHSKATATTFWTACGAVRKSTFDRLGGFDESYSRPSIEDVEFGLRLSSGGGVIELDRNIQVTHHKTWTTGSMFRTDLYCRAIPWTRLLTRYPLPHDLNFRWRDRASCVLIALLPAALWIAAQQDVYWIGPAVLLAIAALNVQLLAYIAGVIGWWRALLCFPLLLMYLSTCVLGLAVGLCEVGRFRSTWVSLRK